MNPDINLKEYIRSIPDFPKPGILFRDITPLLASPTALQEATNRFIEKYQSDNIDAVIAAEARGFIFAVPLALALQASFVPVRKPGKLPFETRAFHYELEYSSDSLEIHTDALKKGDRVLIVDDLLATGGTVRACLELCQHAEVEIAGCAFLIELEDLKGRDGLAPHEVHSLIHYTDGDP